MRISEALSYLIIKYRMDNMAAEWLLQDIDGHGLW